MKLAFKLFAVTVLISSISFGQNVKEGIQNTKQIIEGKKMLERDMKELQMIQAKVTKLKSVYEEEEEIGANELMRDLISDFKREVLQSGEKAKMARKEIAQSSAEIRSDRREIRGNRDDSKNGRFDRRDDKRDMARDKANMRDDRRDRRDDKRDFEMQIQRADEQATILKSLSGHQFKFSEDQAQVNQDKMDLIDQFIVTLKADIEATKRELSEDNRERREDRRERQDDRNERNEKDKKKRKRW